MEEEVPLTVKGQGDSITVTKKAGEFEILVQKGAAVLNVVLNSGAHLVEQAKLVVTSGSETQTSPWAAMKMLPSRRPRTARI